MKPLTLEWVQKAEGDITAARALLDTGHAVHDSIAFHAQQAAEKYIKAMLQEQDIRFPYTHDVALLADLIQPPLDSLKAMDQELIAVSRLAVQVRYPGFTASAEDARRALSIAESIRSLCREQLGLTRA